MPKRVASSALESVVRDNVRRLLGRVYEGKPGRLARLNKNVNLRGVQDFLKGGTCYLSSVQPWADALGVKAYHLFVKDLDVDDIPELVSGRRLAKLKALREEILRDDK